MKKKSKIKNQNTAGNHGLDSFRRRIDDLFSGAHAQAFAKSLDPGLSIKIENLETEIKDRMASTTARINLDWSIAGFALKKAIILHEGHVVAIAGDSDALGANENVKVVTTTTTITTVKKMEVETQVLVFEKMNRS